MNNPQNVPSISNYILEEQEWVPGLRAPFLFWVSIAGATGYLVLGSLWLYHHNKKKIKQEIMNQG